MEPNDMHEPSIPANGFPPRRRETLTQESRPDFLERHYALTELSKAWHISRPTLRSWFRDEPGVILYGSAKLKKGRHRTHLSMRVPESVARKVYRNHTGREV